MLLGVGLGVGAGVGVGVGAGGVEVVEAVENRGFVGSVPRTQASGAVQLLGAMLLPLALQELFAACTIEKRRLFKPVCKNAVPWGLFAASAATDEQAGAADREPSRLWTRPSMLVDGISTLLNVADTGLALVELPTSMVTAAGGRMDGATTSKRSSVRPPFSPPACALAASEVSI